MWSIGGGTLSYVIAGGAAGARFPTVFLSDGGPWDTTETSVGHSPSLTTD